MFRTILTLHLLGAAVWTGGHLVLAASVLPRALRERDPQRVRDFEAAFEPIGLPALVVQVLTGLWLAYRYLPDSRYWLSFSNPLSAGVAAKLVLLATTVALALHARLRLIPRLDARTLPLLGAHIVAVTAIGVLFVVVGAGFRTGGLW
jgi:putative copper export protein